MRKAHSDGLWKRPKGHLRLCGHPSLGANNGPGPAAGRCAQRPAWLITQTSCCGALAWGPAGGLISCGEKPAVPERHEFEVLTAPRRTAPPLPARSARGPGWGRPLRGELQRARLPRCLALQVPGCNLTRPLLLTKNAQPPQHPLQHPPVPTPSVPTLGGY